MNTDIMQVEFSHHIDASEADAEGFYEYYYEYDIYRYTLGAQCLVVRSYSDASTQASVLRLQSWQTPPPPEHLPRQVVHLADSVRQMVAIECATSRLFVLEQRAGQLRVATTCPERVTNTASIPGSAATAA